MLKKVFFSVWTIRAFALVGFLAVLWSLGGMLFSGVDYAVRGYIKSVVASSATTTIVSPTKSVETLVPTLVPTLEPTSEPVVPVAPTEILTNSVEAPVQVPATETLVPTSAPKATPKPVIKPTKVPAPTKAPELPTATPVPVVEPTATPAPAPAPVVLGPEGPSAYWAAGKNLTAFTPQAGDVCWATSAISPAGKSYKFVVVAWTNPSEPWKFTWAGCAAGLASQADQVAAWVGQEYGAVNARGTGPYEVIRP